MNSRKISQEILNVVMQSFAEYAFVHTPEQLQNLLNDPDTDTLFLNELREDIVEILSNSE
ncbi:MAG: hypothetical protein JNN15_18790 [Blastocatellia bacterium]|nr:hypothetical protein [Blastocatellia bacterium]